MPRHTLPALCLTFLLACLAGLVHAQDAPPASTLAPDATAPATDTLTLTQIADQSLLTEKLLEQMKQLAVQPLEFEELKDKLSLAREQVKSLRRDTEQLLQEHKTSAEQLKASQTQWQYLREQLERDQQATKQRAAALEAGLAQVAQEDERWQKIKQQVEGNSGLSDGSKNQRKASSDLNSVRKQLTTPLQEALAVSKQWQELLDVAEEQQMTLRQVEASLRKQLLTSLQPPLWELPHEDFRISEGTRKAIELQVKLAGHYLARFPLRAVLIAAATVGMLVFLWRLRVRRQRMEAGQMGLGLRLPLIDRPLSTTVATSVALALAIYPEPPQLVYSTLSLLLFIPVVRLGLSRLPPIVHPLSWLVSLFFAINNLSVLTEAIPAVQRLWMASCAAISFAVCLHALKKLAASDDRSSLFWRSLRGALWLALLAALVALIGGLAGAATLAQFLITGVANSAYAGLCMVVVAGILGDLAVAAVYLPYSTSSEMVSRNRPLLVGRIGKLAAIVCTLAWLHFTLNQFMLAEPLWAFIRNALNSQLTVGNLAISAGDILAVVVTIWLSFKISQLLRFIFIEDIAPRAKLARGVPDAIATLMHYAIILVGFMLAISAAGIDMSKLAIMAGALGVGIGIGLQDVVNNFTSGLILLFEQHIKQGDIIQCSNVNGRVIHIGLRSSVVRTFDGAEVIVPNGQLVSAQVINWTHSDQQRRITIPVGVAYGSDPDKVIRILIASARAEEEVLSDPEPTAFFLRFGANSMDFELKAWVTSGEILNEVTSRLCAGLYKQLEMAGIQIPFPQQDIYIRSLPAGFSGKG